MSNFWEPWGLDEGRGPLGLDDGRGPWGLDESRGPWGLDEGRGPWGLDEGRGPWGSDWPQLFKSSVGRARWGLQSPFWVECWGPQGVCGPLIPVSRFSFLGPPRTPLSSVCLPFL